MSIVCQWNGDCFEPLGRYRKQCDQDYVVGQVYTLEAILERSTNSHRHYFAQVNDLWQTLPEGLCDRFPSADHLRHYALIKSGFCDERSIVCSSPAEAARVAAFVQPMDTLSIVTVSDYVVRVYTAQSQSYRAMDAKRFQESKTAVLGVISELLGVTKQQLEKATS